MAAFAAGVQGGLRAASWRSAVFGALVARPESFLDGMRIGLAIAALLPLATLVASLGLRPAQQR